MSKQFVSYCSGTPSFRTNDQAGNAAVLSFLTSQSEGGDPNVFAGYHAIVAVRIEDMDRLYPDYKGEPFYITSHGDVYVLTPYPADPTAIERFFSMFLLTDRSILGNWAPTAPGYAQTHLRFKVLSDPDSLRAVPFGKSLDFVSEEEYRNIGVEAQYSPDVLAWGKLQDKQAPVEDKTRINLRDIPLTTRDGRRLVRNSIAQHREVLEDTYKRSASQLTFDEWMEVSQGVLMKALADLEKVDALPDLEYVEAMVTSKKAEVQAYHSKALQEKTTDLHLFDWCQLHFKEDFLDIGRREAMAEVHLEYKPQEIPQLDEEYVEDLPAIFVVSFDGTVVEDQRPIIGPASPFALETLRMIIEKGHHVIFLTSREGDELNEMFDFLRNIGGFVGSIKSLPADGMIDFGDIVYMDEEKRLDVEGAYEMDYLIDVRQFGAPLVDISGSGAGSTMYWGDIVGSLNAKGYLTDEEVTFLMAAMEENQ